MNYLFGVHLKFVNWLWLSHIQDNIVLSTPEIDTLHRIVKNKGYEPNDINWLNSCRMIYSKQYKNENS